MTVTFVRAYDPGPEKTGLGAICLTDAGQLFFTAGGHPELDMGKPTHHARVMAEMQEVRDRGGLVAVECIRGGIYLSKTSWHSGAALIETARVEGRLLECAVSIGLTPIEVGAKQWMADYCRTTYPSPQQIRIIVEGTIGGLPHFHHLDREHAYDGLAIASLVLAQHHKIQMRWPAAVQRAVWEQQQAEKAERERKGSATRAAKASGLPVSGAPPKRWKTRAQRKAIGAGVVAANLAKRAQ
jgi:hypothetical protein